MTEHERKVNDRHIKAYENMDTRNVGMNQRPHD